MNNLFSLEGRVALVTGGSRGIGRMMAAGLLQHGATVYITARKAEACNAAAQELSSLGRCIAVPGDVSTVDGCARPRGGPRQPHGPLAHRREQRGRRLGRRL